ncbi:RHS repeat-associated core domain-containing protein [Pseudomonas sp. SbOxS1]|uniref:RHS repeat-associated core domain-containing protein n=1 Tax=Pseudomonas sp. SbOxS1 TaxID=2723884 RepID=UPI00211DD977|nr:RHS repeat-associated core domain-containing protein [Pseudomonas sp. SbOxS1]
MQPNRETLLCRYLYDSLDRLVDCTPSAQSSTRRFYLKDRLATELQGTEQRSIMQHKDQLLAQQHRQDGNVETRLLVTDQQRSVLNVFDTTRPHPHAYTPYGHRPAQNGLLSLLGFNGERPDPVTGWYLLGNGYRAFNPMLMRFNSPDGWSPFGEGGLNSYAYCAGDPVNRVDPQGHTSRKIKSFLRSVGVMRKSSQRPVVRVSSSPVTLPQESQTIAALQETVVSMQKTISSQQRTIASQQDSIAAAHEVIKDGRIIVARYENSIAEMHQLVAQQNKTMEGLRDELGYFVSLHHMNTPNIRNPISQTDIDLAYPSPPQRNTAIEPETSFSGRAKKIRH